MFLRASRLLIIMSLLSTMGVHLVILQTVAWTRMVVSFSQRNSLNASLQKTFDGRHPCALCLRVKKASQGDSSMQAFRGENQLESLLPCIPCLRKMDITWTLAVARKTAYEYIASMDSPPPKEIPA